MHGFVDPSTLEQIRAASDVVDVIGGYLPLKRNGANFVTLCPFHKEKSPSFNVNPHRQIFHCFGCHKGGDVFRFVMEYENITFPEAIKRLAERAHIPLVFDKSPGQEQARFLKDTLLEMHEQIAQRWQTALQNDAAGQVARDYLKKRGVSDDAVRIFRLGYAPDTWDDTVNWSKSKGYDIATVEKAGLVIHNPEKGSYYDRFRERLMFPICDEQGRIIGFSGRVLSGDEKTAKYVNSPETPIFTKGKVFFGLDKSKRAILDSGFAIICEGQLDLIACYMAGVRNVVAPQGTAFTGDHARILKRYVDEVVLCFDSDTAGQAAAARVQESLLASGLSIRVVTIPSPHDPDSFIKTHGGAAFQELISRSQEFFDFYLDYLCATNDPKTEKGQIAVVKAMGEMVRKSGGALLIDKYAQKTSMRLSGLMGLPLSPDAVRAEFKKASPARPTRSESDSEALGATEPELPEPSEREFWLLRFLFNADDHIDWLAAHLQLEWIEHPTVRAIVAARLDAHFQSTWSGVPAFLSGYEDAFAIRLITEAVTGESASADLERKLAETIRMLRNDQIERRLARLTARLHQPDLPEEEFASIENEKTYLRRWKQEPLRAKADA
ncbi:MAG: DNA primase [Gemmataceae bacterium]|nr:DNA primase [Gemmataceae bacterium]